MFFNDDDMNNDMYFQFDGEAGENFRNGCAIFCRNQSHTLENLKIKVRKDLKLAQLLAVSILTI